MPRGNTNSIYFIAAGYYAKESISIKEYCEEGRTISGVSLGKWK